MSWLKVGPHYIDIVEVTPNDLRADDIIGRADVLSNKITLPHEATASRKLSILFHEIAHMLVTGYTTPDDKIDEETMCCLVGDGLVGLIRDNQQFIEHCVQTLCGVAKGTKKNGKRNTGGKSRYSGRRKSIGFQSERPATTDDKPPDHPNDKGERSGAGEDAGGTGGAGPKRSRRGRKVPGGGADAARGRVCTRRRR